jgi:hypothetical protein
LWRRATIVGAIVLALTLLILLLPGVPGLSWLQQHPNLYGLQAAAVALAAGLGGMVVTWPQWRLWWLGLVVTVGSVAIQILGGPSIWSPREVPAAPTASPSPLDDAPTP